MKDYFETFPDYLDYLEVRNGDRRRSLPTDKRATIELSPHYSNPRFSGKGEVEIWGQKQPGLGYEYSDRFWQWDYQKAKQAAETANEKAAKNTAAWVEAFISAFYDKKLEVCHIYAGVNSSNGYPYWAAGYREIDKAETQGE